MNSWEKNLHDKFNSLSSDGKAEFFSKYDGEFPPKTTDQFRRACICLGLKDYGDFGEWSPWREEEIKAMFIEESREVIRKLRNNHRLYGHELKFSVTLSDMDFSEFLEEE